jgi:hypothetical protein
MCPAPGVDSTGTVQHAVTQRRQRTRTSANTPADPHAHPLAGPLGAREHSANHSHPKAGDMVWPFLDVLWTMIILFCSVAWIRLPILIISDPFQRDVSGGRRAPRLLEGGRDHAARVRSAKAKALT